MHDEWNTIPFTSAQNVLVLMNTVGEGSAASDYYVYLVSAGDDTSKRGNVYKVAGTRDMIYSWNNGLSLGINIDSGMWARINVLYLS